MIYLDFDKEEDLVDLLSRLEGVGWILDKPLAKDFDGTGLGRGLVLSSPRTNYRLALDKTINIAIDGPSGSGKSTIARALADRLGIQYLDTGAMYRALTYYLLQGGQALDQEEEVLARLAGFHLTLEANDWHLNGQVLGDEIRQPAVNKKVSFVASLKEVRDFMTDLQRRLSQENSTVLDGRDIGTVVLPQAQFKFFLDADPLVRAQRRSAQLGEEDVEKMKEELLARDRADSTRALAPLRQAEDAILIDNTKDTMEETLEKIYQRICGEIHAV